MMTSNHGARPGHAIVVKLMNPKLIFQSEFINQHTILISFSFTIFFLTVILTKILPHAKAQHNNKSPEMKGWRYEQSLKNFYHCYRLCHNSSFKLDLLHVHVLKIWD